MKILEFITKSNWGGAQRHVFDISNFLKKKSYDITVAVGGDGILKEKLQNEGIDVRVLSHLGRDINVKNDLKSFIHIFKVINLIKPDILHLHSPKAAGIGALAARIMGVRNIIQTIHGWSFNEDRPLLEKILIAVLSWVTTILCHKTIVISEHDYNQAMYFPFVRKKIILIPLGIEMPTFMSIDGAKQLLAKKIGMDYSLFKKKTVFGTISELHNNKGLIYLIEAFINVVKKHPNSIVIIIGDGEQRNNLEELIKKNKLEKNVYLAGYIDMAKEYLKGFDIFVFPSIKEGLPYALLEAGMASLPIISTTVGGIPDIIEDMKTGILIQPKRVDELNYAMDFAIENIKDMKKYGKDLKEKVSSKFSILKMLDEIEKLFKSSIDP